jgi:hypothetical protein
MIAATWHEDSVGLAAGGNSAYIQVGHGLEALPVTFTALSNCLSQQAMVQAFFMTLQAAHGSATGCPYPKRGVPINSFSINSFFTLHFI